MSKKSNIDIEVEHVLSSLAKLEPDSEQYTAAVKNLKELCEARSKRATRLIDPDTLVAAATNLLGIVLILQYEHIHVIATKAMGFVARGRI